MDLWLFENTNCEVHCKNHSNIVNEYKLQELCQNLTYKVQQGNFMYQINPVKFMRPSNHVTALKNGIVTNWP